MQKMFSILEDHESENTGVGGNVVNCLSLLFNKPDCVETWIQLLLVTVHLLLTTRKPRVLDGLKFS
jgi:hypothetical protein